MRQCSVHTAITTKSLGIDYKSTQNIMILAPKPVPTFLKIFLVSGELFLVSGELL